MRAPIWNDPLNLSQRCLLKLGCFVSNKGVCFLGTLSRKGWWGGGGGGGDRVLN